MAEYIERFGDTCDADGRRLVVRNGQAQERTVTCGAGTWRVRAPRVNDKPVDADGAHERFTSRVLPFYMRRSAQVSQVPRYCICGVCRRATSGRRYRRSRTRRA